MHSAAIAVSLLLLASAVAMQVSADSELSVGNNVEPFETDLSETDVLNLSDEELEALQEQFVVYGKYCGPGIRVYGAARIVSLRAVSLIMSHTAVHDVYVAHCS